MAWQAADVVVESTPLSTTGGHTWAAARRLAAYLSASAEQLGLAAPGLRLLELGSGTGWLGCTIARNLHPSSLICLTEQEGGLAWLRHNVDLNRGAGLPLANVRVQACDWTEYGCGDSSGGGGGNGGSGSGGGKDGGSGSSGSRDGPGGGLNAPQEQPQKQQQPQEQPQEQQRQAYQVGGTGDADSSALPADQAGRQGGKPGAELTGAELAGGDLDLRCVRWDYIVGSDLIYNEIGSHCLPRVLAALAGRSTTILYCHTKHRFDLLDWEFLEQLEACGLQCEEVWEPGTPPPPPSPPAQFPPATLFPDQRIAVYRISQRGGSS